RPANPRARLRHEVSHPRGCVWQAEGARRGRGDGEERTRLTSHTPLVSGDPIYAPRRTPGVRCGLNNVPIRAGSPPDEAVANETGSVQLPDVAGAVGDVLQQDVGVAIAVEIARAFCMPVRSWCPPNETAANQVGAIELPDITIAGVD